MDEKTKKIIKTIAAAFLFLFYGVATIAIIAASISLANFGLAAYMLLGENEQILVDAIVGILGFFILSIIALRTSDWCEQNLRAFLELTKKEKR